MVCAIRPSRPTDLAAVREIYASHAFHSLSSFEAVPPDPAALARRRDEVLGRGPPYRVAEVEGRGVGRALLGRLVALCEAAGYRQMIAVIGDSANAASINLHATFGFRHVGQLPPVGFRFGRSIAVVPRQRPFGPGGATLPESAGAR